MLVHSHPRIFTRQQQASGAGASSLQRCEFCPRNMNTVAALLVTRRAPTAARYDARSLHRTTGPRGQLFPREHVCPREQTSTKTATTVRFGVADEADNLTTDLPIFLRVEEVAAVLRTSPKAIYTMIERHQLPGVTRVRRRVLVRRDLLLHWLRQESAPSPKEQVMSVTVRSHKRGGGWEIDILVLLPDGTRHRDRKTIVGVSKSVATRWGQDRERHLLLHGLPKPTKEVPTLQESHRSFSTGTRSRIGTSRAGSPRKRRSSRST